jgi:predicted acetyltransferase
MTERTENLLGQIELIPAERHQQAIVANLLELYIHDFSEFLAVEIGANGRFGYKDLPLYWSDPDRHPFLVNVDRKLAGLVFVRRFPEARGDEALYDMVEFFIMRRYRRLGAGTQVAHEVWRRFPGRWQVRVIELNVAGLSFWPRAISAFLGEAVDPVRVEKDGKFWQFFEFETCEQP